MPENATGVVIREFRQTDKDGVGLLYSTVFGEIAWRAFLHRWRWQFEKNPAEKLGKSTMWVAESETGVVGFLASFLTRFKILEREAAVRFPCDLMVSSEARGHGIGEKLIREYIASEQTLVNALGYSPASGRMFLRLGYQVVDAEPLMMRPCDFRSVACDVLLRKSENRLIQAFVPAVSRSIGGLLNLGVRVADAVYRPKISPSISIRRCTAPDDGFDDLWERLSPAFPIVGIRDKKWIQWRFFEDPNFKHALFSAYSERGELQGYVDVRVGKRRNLLIGRIMDIFCDPNDTELVESLLAAGIDELESNGVDLITCLGHLPSVNKAVRRYCYLTPKRLQNPALFIWKGQADLESRVLTGDNWHLTHADGDDGFSP